MTDDFEEAIHCLPGLSDNRRLKARGCHAKALLSWGRELHRNQKWKDAQEKFKAAIESKLLPEKLQKKAKVFAKQCEVSGGSTKVTTVQEWVKEKKLEAAWPVFEMDTFGGFSKDEDAPIKQLWEELYNPPPNDDDDDIDEDDPDWSKKRADIIKAVKKCIKAK